MPQPPYRVAERLSDEENRQPVERRSNVKPSPPQEQHETSVPPKVANVACAGYAQRTCFAPRFGKAKRAISIRCGKEQLFHEFPEWWKRQGNVPK